jgi:hypothetical protein
MLLPDYEPRHLTAIDAQGPLAIYDTCATRGPAAHLQSGPLTGLPLGECGELLAWKDGKPFNPPSAKDGRTLWKCHDRLPWLVAANDRTDSGLLSACVQASVYNMQPGMNMPPDPHEISFAHKGALGWANNPGGGFTGHFANSAENAGRLSKRNQRAHDVWTGWLVTMKVYRMKYPDWPARAGFTETREIHTYLTRAWLAWHLTGDNFWREDCHHVADFLLSKPLAEHGSTALNDPLWPYTLWMIKGDAAREWLLDAAKWYFARSPCIQPPWTVAGQLARLVLSRARHALGLGGALPGPDGRHGLRTVAAGQGRHDSLRVRCERTAQVFVAEHLSDARRPVCESDR